MAQIGCRLYTAGRRACASLMLPVAVLGGIYGGVFTPTEASVIAVVVALMIGFVFHRELKLRDLPVIFCKSVIMFIIAAAGLFSYLITQAGVPAALGRYLADTFSGPWAFLIAVNVVLFVVGVFIETPASIIVLAPVTIAFGIDPMHFGIIMVVYLAIGMFTPPFGVNLFAASAVARVPLNRMVTFIGVVMPVSGGHHLLVRRWRSPSVISSIAERSRARRGPSPARMAADRQPGRQPAPPRWSGSIDLLFCLDDHDTAHGRQPAPAEMLDRSR